MSNFKHFQFEYPVTARNNNGKIALISTVTVYANAHFYPDGSVRTVDVIDVIDCEENNIGSWMGFIETHEGNLNEVLEASATAHAVGLFEDKGVKAKEEIRNDDKDAFDVFGSLGKIFQPVKESTY